MLIFICLPKKIRGANQKTQSMWSIKHVWACGDTPQHKQTPATAVVGPRTRERITMASTKVIATTWAKKDLLKKLHDTLKRMDAEIDAWEKERASLERRQDAWDKKAVAWAKKNITKAKDVSATTYHNRFQFNYTFDLELAKPALGERPNDTRSPQYKEARYDEVSEYAQIQNAIALIEGSTDTEFKINTSSVWASFIR